ncbi:MAG: hypothetical protein EOO85_28090 [Pedobacter sp.]|nr:MAG: hypothetical protein EOO85_28090 [Pedobacter sp.]
MLRAQDLASYASGSRVNAQSIAVWNTRHICDSNRLYMAYELGIIGGLVSGLMLLTNNAVLDFHHFLIPLSCGGSLGG